VNEEIKEKWITALRSGEYAQTTHMLNDGKGMCCLGVLCDIYSKEKDVDWVFKKPHMNTSFLRGHMLGDSVSLPYEVVVWAGLRSGNPELSFQTLDEEYSPDDANIAALNDECNLNFNQIADVIGAFL
jgi:hypothetical protein